MSLTKRYFTIVIGSKETGRYISSNPSSAAKKVVSKLCSVNKHKKVEFCIRETTQFSKKKVYGPYLGEMKKLEKPIKLKDHVIHYKPSVHIKKEKIRIKMRGGEGFELSKFIIEDYDNRSLILELLEIKRNNSSLIVNGNNCKITRLNPSKYIIELETGTIKFNICFSFHEKKLNAMIQLIKTSNITVRIDELETVLTVQSKLGSGAFGSVYNVLIKDRNYALKVGLDIPEKDNTSITSIILLEVAIFKKLRSLPSNSFIIDSYPINFPLGPAILLEVGQKTLESIIKNEQNSFSFIEKIKVFNHILQAVQFLHSNGIIHRDIKPANILFVDGIPKLCDFGLSYDLGIEGRHHSVGTREYKNKIFRKRNTSKNSFYQDIYACCVILIEMLVGNRVEPFTSEEIESQLRLKGMKEPYFTQIITICNFCFEQEPIDSIIKIAQSIQ